MFNVFKIIIAPLLTLSCKTDISKTSDKKNKHLTLNLNKEVRNLIHNRLYSQLKNLFIKISQVNLKEKNYISFVIDSIQFLFIFKMKKTLRFMISELS